MARTMQIPLDIHVIDTAPPAPVDDCDGQLFQFLSAATRIRSLNLVTQRAFEHFHSVIFESCFTGAIPGTLTQLRISDETLNDSDDDVGFHRFLEPTENPENAESLLLDFPKQHLEDLWRPVTILRLHGLYPRWESQAYHGLVELRLSPWASRPHMTESQFIGILTASPRLRILHLNMAIDALPEYQHALPERIRLSELEVLNLEKLDWWEYEAILRLLAPGTKPLRLSLDLPDTSTFTDILLNEQIKLFFARSNVAKLYVLGSDRTLSLAELRRMFPHLRTLALDDLDNRTDLALDSNISKSQALAAFPHLDDLYMMSCTLDLDKLRCMLKSHPVHTLTIWDCIVIHNGLVVSDEELSNRLSGILSDICPVIRVLMGDETPIEDWELYQYSD